jgi:hypothetical protein
MGRRQERRDQPPFAVGYLRKAHGWPRSVPGLVRGCFSPSAKNLNECGIMRETGAPLRSTRAGFFDPRPWVDLAAASASS